MSESEIQILKIDRLAPLVRTMEHIARQLENGLSVKLASKQKPGMCDYISKADAAHWCEVLAENAREALAEVKA